MYGRGPPMRGPPMGYYGGPPPPYRGGPMGGPMGGQMGMPHMQGQYNNGGMGGGVPPTNPQVETGTPTAGNTTPVSKEKACTVYVGKISPKAANTLMRTLLEACGPVSEWKRMQDPETREYKKFGFCVYVNEESVLRAVRLLNGREVLGSKLLVKVNEESQRYLDAHVRQVKEKRVAELNTNAQAEHTVATQERGGGPVSPLKTYTVADVEEDYEMEQGEGDLRAQGLIEEALKDESVASVLSVLDEPTRGSSGGRHSRSRGHRGDERPLEDARLSSEIGKFRDAAEKFDRRHRERDQKERDSRRRERVEREKKEDQRVSKAKRAAQRELERFRGEVSHYERKEERRRGELEKYEREIAVRNEKAEQNLEDLQKILEDVAGAAAAVQDERRKGGKRRLEGVNSSAKRERRRVRRAEEEADERLRVREESEARTAAATRESERRKAEEKRAESARQAGVKIDPAPAVSADVSNSSSRKHARDEEPSISANASSGVVADEPPAKRPRLADGANGGELTRFELKAQLQGRQKDAYAAFVDQLHRSMGTNPSEKDIAKALVLRVPIEREELFAFTIDWDAFDLMGVVGASVKPWIGKKMREYLGVEAPEFVDGIVSKLKPGVTAASLLPDIEQVLDEDAEPFVVKLWRKLVYENEAVRVGFST